MIAFEFEYACPKTVREAVEMYHQSKKENKQALYYAGGTEIISRARANEIKFDVIIDIKQIQECNMMTVENGKFLLGAVTTLSDIVDANMFPLLSELTRHIAHHTARNKITVGGNIASHLPYKEVLLPFLLADSTVAIATKGGKVKHVSIHDLEKKHALQDGEFILQVMTDEKYMQAPFFHSKKTRQSNVNYPIVTLASLRIENETRIALSGATSSPFRFNEGETIINDKATSIEKRIQKALKKLPSPLLQDMYASSEFRRFLIERAFIEMLQDIKGASS